MKYILNGKEMNTCMIGTWAWGTGQNGGRIVFGNRYPEHQLIESFDTAFAHGFNFWDTAEVYGNGTAEMLLGGLIRNKDIVISTKHFPSRKYKSGENVLALNGSLSRLGVESVDIYWLHTPKNIEQNMKELAGLQKEGLIKSIGISNASVSDIRLADIVLRENGSSLAAVQNHYSLLSMKRERQILSYCQSNRILFFGYMILEQGALSGHYDSLHPFPAMSIRGASFPARKFRRIQPLIDYIRVLANKYDVDPSQIPLAWAIEKGIIPIVGVTKPEHARSLSKGLGIHLEQFEIRRLEKFALDSGVRCKGFWE